jgi:hypothetical protein
MDISVKDRKTKFVNALDNVNEVCNAADIVRHVVMVDNGKLGRARILLLWLIMGMLYLTIEVLFRGKSHISMLAVGGICGLWVGSINQIPQFYKTRIIFQSVIGALIVLLVEFIAGCILNLWLGLNVWSYDGKPGNILGQVCVQFGFLWLLLMPFAIWLEDTVRWLIYTWDKFMGHESKKPPNIPPYTNKSIYIDFFTGK